MRNDVIGCLILLALVIPQLLHAQPAGPGRRGPGAGGPGGGEAFFPSRTEPKTEREKAVVAVLNEMGQQQRQGTMSVPVNDGRLLRILAESIGAKHVVELGTSIGYSAIWFALALESTDGKLTTFEIDEGRAATARANFKRAGVEQRIKLVLGDAHEKIAEVEGPIDLVFIDADKEGYLDYLNKLLPKVRPGGLIVAHNMNRQQADPAYVKAITTNAALETVFVSTGASGIGVSMKKR